MQFVTSGSVREGVLYLRNRKRMDADLSKWKDCEVVVTVERAHATRSAAMNRLYWGVYVKELSEYTGFTPNEMHDVLKAKFMPKTLALSDGNGEVVGEFVIGGTTTKLNKLEFGDYLREIKAWAETLGVVIPEPDTEASMA